ncbi:MAG TPA: glycosyltransferase family 4 protein [Beijerinckiaceae bacterium]|nr:glycosyltransferase family 4 protein [Beijerinckiaceae bacterium]
MQVRPLKGREVGSVTSGDAVAPLRVLCVTPAGPEGMGGIDRLYHYMREHMGTGGGAPDISIRYFASRGPRDGYRSFLGFPFRLLAFVWVLLRSRADIVHLNHSTHGSAVRKWALALVARLFGCRVTTHFHGMITPEDYAANPFWLGLFRSLCGMSDRIVVLGDVFTRWFRDTLGVAPERLVVIPNGIPDFAPDLALPKPAGPDRLILFAGEVGPRKGAGLLLEALAMVRARLGDWRCVMAGNGDIHEYRAMTQMLGLKDRVRFTGWVGPDAVHALMREAVVVVLPSRVEALPLSLIEGACAGCALIASNAGASAEIARDGVNGRIVPLEAEAIADVLTEVLSSPDLLARMQESSRALYVERFRIEAFEAALLAMFRSLAPPSREAARLLTPSPDPAP